MKNKRVFNSIAVFIISTIVEIWFVHENYSTTDNNGSSFIEFIFGALIMNALILLIYLGMTYESKLTSISPPSQLEGSALSILKYYIKNLRKEDCAINYKTFNQNHWVSITKKEVYIFNLHNELKISRDNHLERHRYYILNPIKLEIDGKIWNSEFFNDYFMFLEFNIGEYNILVTEELAKSGIKSINELNNFLYKTYFSPL